MPTALSEPLPADVIAAAQRGQKIEAIKLLRERTGMGLAEAKDAVDAFIEGDTTLQGGIASRREGGSLRALSFVVIAAVLLAMGYFFLPALSR